MAEPTYIFQFIGDTFSNQTANYISGTASQISSELQPVAIAAITLWICVYGTLTILGKTSQPFADFAVKALKIIIICAVALNYGNYSSYVIQSMEGIENSIAAAMSSGGSPSSNGIYGTLDAALSNGLEKSKLFFAYAAKYNFLVNTTKVIGGISAGIISYTGVLLFLVIGGVAIILAKFMLTLVFAVGPLFILCLLFPVTAGFFDRWIAQAITYILTVVFVAATLGIGISIMDTRLQALVVDQHSDPMFTAIQLLAIMAILAYVTYQVNNLAAGLAGGAGAAMVSMRQLAGYATGEVSKAANVINATSTRTNPTTGQQVTASRFSHWAYGRTLSNSNYRSAVKERMNHNINHMADNWRKKGGSVDKG